MSDRYVYPYEIGTTPAGDIIGIDLFYPGTADQCHTVQIGLCAVRAADDIRVTYDFERDGWAILQEVGIEHDGYREATGEWAEVAFVGAWSQTKPAAAI